MTERERSLGDEIMSQGVMITEPFGASVRAARWRGEWTQLVDTILCDREATFSLELLSPPPPTRAFVDVRPVDGHVRFADGTTAPALRTYHAAGLAPFVTYPYVSKGLRMHVSTGYEVETQPGYWVVVTRSEHAGFRVSRPSRWVREYHAALGPPGTDFEALVFRVVVHCAGDTGAS